MQVFNRDDPGYLRDDPGYLTWIEHHSNGYVVNINSLRKNRSMIHTSRCTHLYEPERAKTHTISYGKACSTDIQELLDWAGATGQTIVQCSSCRPE